jgi:hypothetical protein
MKRIDPLTKRTFIAKRTNQKFETRENQIRYNNLKARKARMKMAPWETALKKNYRILSQIIGDQKRAIADPLELKYKGYDSTVFSQYRNDDKCREFGIYHYKVREYRNGQIIIVDEG